MAFGPEELVNERKNKISEGKWRTEDLCAGRAPKAENEVKELHWKQGDSEKNEGKVKEETEDGIEGKEEEIFWE